MKGTSAVPASNRKSLGDKDLRTSSLSACIKRPTKVSFTLCSACIMRPIKSTFCCICNLQSTHVWIAVWRRAWTSWRLWPIAGLSHHRRRRNQPGLAVGPAWLKARPALDYFLDLWMHFAMSPRPEGSLSVCVMGLLMQLVGMIHTGARSET